MQPNNDTIQNRIFNLLSVVLEDGNLIPKMYHSVILNFVKPYLQKTPDEVLKEQIKKLRDEVIPFILGE